MADEHSHLIDDDARDWRITQCACGQITLRLGRIRIDCAREELAELHCLVQRAMQEFEIAESRRPVGHRRTAMH
jgi:hypothetical protein